MAETTGIFICPSCQAMVKGAMDGEEDLVCHECGYRFEREPGDVKKVTAVPVGRSAGRSSSVIRNLTAKKAAPVRPVPKVSAPPVAAKPIEQAKAEGGLGSDDEEIIMPDGTRRVRRRKRRKKDEKNRGLVLFLLGWFCVIVIILVMFKFGRNEKVPEEEVDQTRLEAADRAARDLAVMRRLLPEISEKFKGERGSAKDPRGFLFQPTLDARKQYIDQLDDLSLAFSRHYENTVFPVPKSTQTEVRRIDENVLSFLDDDIAIETIWEDSTGQRWGAVHVFDKAESWKLDWEAFAPYSTESWAKFRGNLGAKEGVFRLLVRKRLSVNEEDSFYVSFYRAPYVFETDNEYKNTQSPEVELETDSDLGRQFLKLWDDYQEGRAPYGSILAKNLDPRGHMRITVRLAWEDDGESGEKMVLKEILGVGWFGKRIQEFHAEELRRATEKATEKLTEPSVGDS